MKTLCFDFDGVINSYISGWQGVSNIPDKPVMGMRELIAELRHEGYEVVVSSSRCSSGEGICAVKDYLEKYGIVVDRITPDKPPAIAYIDDRAIKFTGDIPKLYEEIKNFKVWTQRPAKIASGKEVAESIKNEAKLIATGLKRVPKLAIIQIGDDYASNVYVKGKIRDCEEVGFTVEHLKFPETVSEDEILVQISKLNKRDDVSGIIVQTPYPEHIRGPYINDAIDSVKDVDGVSPTNVTALYHNYVDEHSLIAPCTPLGILRILDYYNYDVKGKQCVIVGRSTTVGRPLAELLTKRDATVTLCHSKTKHCIDLMRNADVLVVAVGHEGLVDAYSVKEGAFVIDVGINRNSLGKVTGDVDFSTVYYKASYITPVPGGVGLVTRAMVLRNLARLECIRESRS